MSKKAKGNADAPPSGVLKESKKPRGGARPGAGMPKGTITRKTMEKEAIRQYIRERVAAELDPLLDAQIANAKGLSYLVTRDKRTGKFIRVTEAMAKTKDLGENEEIIEVWEKDPSVQAFTDLLNRAADKPKEQEQEIKLTGEADMIQRLLNGRKRAAEARAQRG